MVEKKFGLVSFIDSCVWGSADELLKKIDKQYCKQEGTEYFDYEKRNFSTSHIHMMLSIALGKVMNNCEAIFFLNTEESICTEDIINNKTYSPWIYFEVFMANNIEKKWPLRKGYLEELHEEFSEVHNSLSVKYTLNLDDFVDLSSQDLNEWNNKYNHIEHPLDTLYKDKKVIEDDKKVVKR